MDTTSLWQHISKKKDKYPQLTKDLDVDVTVIGGGITGVTTALQLIRAGKKVAILEAETIGGVTTQRSTGNLYVAIQPYYQHLISKSDLDTARTVAKSRDFGINFIEKTIQDNNIKCQFARRPWFLYTNDEKQISSVEKEVEAFNKMQFNLHFVDSLPLGMPFKRAARLDNQARFNPLQYVLSVAEILKENGCHIFENTRVIELEETDHCVVKTSTGNQVKSLKIVMATHTPIGICSTQMFTAPYRDYVVAAKSDACPEGHYWDVESPHHSIATHAEEGENPELLLIAGSHHKVGQDKHTSENFFKLEKFCSKEFGLDDIAYRWSAQHYKTGDDLPYIGLVSRFAKHTYMGTGYFADGLVYGTIAGILLSDLILGANNHWAKIYDSTRSSLGSAAGFLIKENANIMMQYYKDFPTKSIKSFDYLKPNEADVVEIDREKWAVYKDKNEQVHIVSAVCTHMKCIVGWNEAEKTWDCPCHGSRFTIDGSVIEGPALTELKKRD